MADGLLAEHSHCVCVDRGLLHHQPAPHRVQCQCPLVPAVCGFLLPSSAVPDYHLSTHRGGWGEGAALHLWLFLPGAGHGCAGCGRRHPGAGPGGGLPQLLR